MTVLASSLSQAAFRASSAPALSEPDSSMSKTLPWRTLSTPAMPSDFSAPSMAFPCGSRTPVFRVTVTRAFIGGSLDGSLDNLASSCSDLARIAIERRERQGNPVRGKLHTGGDIGETVVGEAV